MGTWGVCVVAAIGFTLSSAWSQLASSSIAGEHKAPEMLPFTATIKTTQVQTLANGATITSESESTQAQDSMGRTYYSSTTNSALTGRSALTFYQVSDPVTHTSERWDSESKKVTVTVLPPKDQQRGCWVNDSGNSHFSYGAEPEEQSARKPNAPKRSATAMPVAISSAPKESYEDLGTQTIQGLQVHGYRGTLTVPAGQMGNDQPLITTSERWRSEVYGIDAREITDDPRQGKTTKELTNFSAGEPDSALFQIPDGYEVLTDQLHRVSCGR